MWVLKFIEKNFTITFSIGQRLWNMWLVCEDQGKKQKYLFIQYSVVSTQIVQTKHEYILHFKIGQTSRAQQLDNQKMLAYAT